MSSEPHPHTASGPAGKTLRVALFAGIAEAVGARWLDLSWNGGTVRELRGVIGRENPSVTPLLERSVIAVGTRFAADDDRVAAGDDVAVIPPVSGG